MPASLISRAQILQSLDSVARASASLAPTSTLGSKIRHLSQQRSPDPLQQLQTDAIVDLYQSVRQIQEAIWPLLSIIPDVSGARDAAQAAGSTTSATSATARALRHT